ncbi:graves disease carrier protein [Plakobranchus ocellatus]|uniref:Graves disease carrier protein n=1 Tax=Plakobranchus ocellatus TaxID=259542 RepID=A0AAV4BII7_9GAST|nr:graves disease carrier protein [Plakobranchus ocellatus]
MVGQIEGAADSNAVVALKTFISGGIAGCCAKSTVAPLDRVKILLQAHNVHYKDLGVFSATANIIRKEGFTGLYKGNGVQMIRIFPYAAIQFLAYEQMKRTAKQLSYLNHKPYVSKLICGSLAGLTAVMCTYPLDMIRSRLAFQACLSTFGITKSRLERIQKNLTPTGLTAVMCTYPLDMIRSRLAFQVKGETVYTGIRHTYKSIVLLEGGTRGLYQGIVPTVLGMAPYAGISFCSFEMLKSLALENFPDTLGTHQEGSEGLVLILPAKLLCGGLAGAIAQTVSYPLDVVRRKMQLSGMSILTEEGTTVKIPRSWRQVLVNVYQEDGITRGLFRGMSINYLRIMPTVAISFATYESLKQALGLDTSLDR